MLEDDFTYVEDPVYEKGSMEDILQAFSFNNLQSALQIKAVLDKHSITWDKYRQWIQKRLDSGEPPPLRPMPERIRTKLEKSNITWEQFIDWIEMVRHMRLPDEIVVNDNRERACPECGQPMKQWPVNSHAGDQVGGDWKSMWNCKYCGYDELDPSMIPTKVVKTTKTPRKAQKPKSRIIDPKNVRMLYYGNRRRRR